MLRKYGKKGEGSIGMEVREVNNKITKQSLTIVSLQDWISTEDSDHKFFLCFVGSLVYESATKK